MSNEILLVTRPEHDYGARYLSYWAKKVIETAERKGSKVVDLNKKKSTREEFEGRISKLNPSLVFLNGHGQEDCVAGHNNEILIKKRENEKLLKNKITYTVSCDSARKLGVVCADEQTTYIGYDDKFVFSFNQKYLSKPLADKRAARFLDASNQVPICLIKGHTAREASSRSKEFFRKQIILLISKEDPDALSDAKDLFFNMSHQVCLGNKEAVL